MIDKTIPCAIGERQAIYASPIPFSTRERIIILSFSFLGTVFDGADFAIFLFFMVPLAHYLQVSIVEVSMIQASSYVIGIIGGIAFGAVADRWGRRLGLALTVAMFGVFTFLTAFAHSYPTLLIMRALAGIGIGGEAGIAFAYVNEAFPRPDDRRGLFSALLQSMLLVGIWLAAWVYSATAATYGIDAWRWAFGYLGLAALLSGAVRIFMPESRLWQAAREARVVVPQRTRFKEIPVFAMFSNGLAPRIFGATLLSSFSFYGAYAVVTYAPAMWQTVYHLPSAMVGRLGMIGSVVGGLSYLIGGALSDWKGRRWAFAVTSAVGVVANALFLLSVLGILGPNQVHGAVTWSSPVILSYILVQFGYGYFGVLGVWLSELFPTRVRTTAYNSVYYTGRAIGGGLAPLLGLLASRALGLGLEFAVAFGIVGAIGSLTLCGLLSETQGKALSN